MQDNFFYLIDADCGDLLITGQNEISNRFLKFLTKKTKKYINIKYLEAEFKCNFEHAKRICIKKFTEGKLKF